MAMILKNVKLFAGGVNLTSFNNKIEVTAEVDEKDVTTFGSYDATTDKVWTEVIGGLAKAKISGSGPNSYAEDAVDETMFAALGGIGALSACPAGAGYGALAYLTNALQGNYKQLGQVGEVAPWDASWSSSGPMCRGVSLHPESTARTSSGDGTAVEHVAVPAGHRLYANLHVFSVAGTDTPTLDVIVESDVDALFNGSETTRITFDSATAVGGQSKSVAGAITDTFFRCSFAVSGTDPSFLFNVTLGVF